MRGSGFLVESREFGPHVRHVRFVSSCWVSPFCFSTWSPSKSSSRKVTSILLLVDSFILLVQASLSPHSLEDIRPWTMQSRLFRWLSRQQSHGWHQNSQGWCIESALLVKCCVIVPRCFLENCKSVMAVSNLSSSA